MNRFLKNLFGITFGVPGAETWQAAYNFQHGLPMNYGGQYGTALTEPYRQHGTLAKAVSTIANDAASVQWEVVRRSASGRLGDKPDLRHPILSVWRNPNPLMNGKQLFIGSYISKYLWGEYFWYYPNLKITRPTPGSSPRIEQILEESTSLNGDAQIWLLDPRKVIIEITEGGELQHYLETEGSRTRLDSEKLTHSKRWNPYNNLRGLSKVESVIAELAGDHAAAEWNKRFFSDQNGLPSGLLVPGQGSLQVTDDQRRDYRRMWNQQHGGVKRSIGILPAGWTFQDLGLSQRDMDFRSLREYSREQILAAFGVPPFIAGVLDKANYANAREQKDVYWNGTIRSLLSDEADILNEDFFPKAGIDNYVVRSDWEKVSALLEDVKEKAEVADRLFRMGFTKRQINERLNMGLEVDELEDADVGYIQSNFLPTAVLNDPEFTSIYVTSKEDNEPEPEEEAAPEEEPEAPPTKSAAKLEAEWHNTVLWKTVTRRTLKYEEEFRNKVRAHFHNIKLEVLENIGNLKGFLARQKNDVNQLIFDTDDADERIQKVTKPVYEKAIKAAGEGLLAEVGIASSFAVQDPRVAAQLLRLTRRIKGVNETLEKQLREALLEEFNAEGGTTVDRLRDVVAEVMDHANNRSRTIARTEMASANSAGRMEAMNQADIKKHRWLSARDPRVRDEHLPGSGNDGKVREIGKPFPSGSRWPHDPNGRAEDTINCRCTTIPVLEDSDE